MLPLYIRRILRILNDFFRSARLHEAVTLIAFYYWKYRQISVTVQCVVQVCSKSANFSELKYVYIVCRLIRCSLGVSYPTVVISRTIKKSLLHSECSYGYDLLIVHIMLHCQQKQRYCINSGCNLLTEHDIKTNNKKRYIAQKIFRRCNKGFDAEDPVHVNYKSLKELNAE